MEDFELREYVENMAARGDVTGCPVPWCDDAGAHWWPHELDGSRGMRMHEHEVWRDHGGVISVEMLESQGPPHGDDEDVVVNVFADDLRFASTDEVRRFIAGLLQAASIAFPSGE